MNDDFKAYDLAVKHGCDGDFALDGLDLDLTDLELDLIDFE